MVKQQLQMVKQRLQMVKQQLLLLHLPHLVWLL